MRQLWVVRRELSLLTRGLSVFAKQAMISREEEKRRFAVH